MGISSKKIRHWIAVYSLMVKHHETKANRWSHYDELLKNRDIQKVLEDNPEFTKIVVGKIKSGEIDKAVDVRDKVTKIAKAGGRVLKNFIEKDRSLDKCYEAAVSGGATNVLYNKLHKFREAISCPEATEEIDQMQQKVREKCKFELQRIKKRVDFLIKSLS